MHPSAQSRGRSESGTKDRPVLKKRQVTVDQYLSGALLEKENRSSQSKMRRDSLPESRPLPPDRPRSDKPAVSQSAQSAEPKLRRTSSPPAEHKTTSRIHQLETLDSENKKINDMLSNTIEERLLEIVDFKKKVEELEQGKRNCDQALKAMADVLAQIGRENEEKYDALNEQYITVCDQKQRVAEENRTNLKALKKGEAKVAEEKLKVTQLEADVENLTQKSKAEKDALIAELKKLREQMGSSHTADLLAQKGREDDEKYAALNVQYTTVRDQKQRVAEENRTNLKALKKSEDKVAEEKLKVTQLEADVENLTQKSKAEKDALIAELKKLREQMGSKDEVAKLKGQLHEVRNTRRRDESKNKSLTKKLADSEEVVKYLNIEVVNLKFVTTTVRDELKEAEDKLEGFKSPNSDKKEAEYCPISFRRRHPSDSSETTSSSSSKAEYGEPMRKVIRKNGWSQ